MFNIILPNGAHSPNQKINDYDDDHHHHHNNIILDTVDGARMEN